MKWPQRMLAVSVAGAVVLYASFFAAFNATLSDWSGFGFTWTVQIFHNFLHGRPFQSSIFATVSTGGSVGFTANPYAFIHANVIHVNFTPYAFAWLWALRQTPAAIYALLFAWNLAAGGALSVSILRRGGSTDWRARAALAGTALAFGGLLSVLCQMGQLLLFAGPFMLGAYDAFLARRRWLFLAWIAALALVTEDAAMVAVCFGGYFLLFEEEGKAYAAVALAFSLPYLLLLLTVVQPAARAELTMSASSTTVAVARLLFSLTPAVLGRNLFSMAPLLPFVPLYLVAACLFGLPDRRSSWKVAALAIVPAFPHWGECVVVGGAHHLLPPWYGLLLGLLCWLRTARGPVFRPRLLPAAVALFFVAALRVQAGHLPAALKVPLYRASGKGEKADALVRSLASEEASNRAVIAAAASVPPERGLSYLTNNHVTGFIVARSDVWIFPDYYDTADYLLVQKDATDATCAFETGGPATRESLARTLCRNVRLQPVTPAMVEAVRAVLVGGGTHAVAREDEHVLLLERKERVPFLSPPSTYGWGWLRAAIARGRGRTPAER